MDTNNTIDFEIVKISVFNVNDRPKVTLHIPTDGYPVKTEEVTLVWIGEDADYDKLTYDLFVDDGDGNGLEVEVKGHEASEYSLTGLHNGTYRWTVEAFDGALKSERPKALSFEVKLPGPDPGPEPNQTEPNLPPSVTLQKPANGDEVPTLLPTLIWEGNDPDGDDMSYHVYVNDSKGRNIYKTISEFPLLTLPNELTNNERYYWTVLPHDGKVFGLCRDGTWYFTVNRTGTQESTPPEILVDVYPEGEIDEDTMVNFNASRSFDADGVITLFIWSFGDGTTLTGPQYINVNHTFEKGGTYNVSLVVFDNDGKTDIWAQTVKVKEPPPPPPPPPPDEPTVAGLTMAQLLIAIIVTAILVALITYGAVYAHRRMKYEQYTIEQLFLVYKDGRLLDHVGPEEGDEKMDKQILGSMLTAVQDFVSHSLKDEKKKKGALTELDYGDYKIVLERGKWTFLAAFMKGHAGDEVRGKMRELVGEIEEKNADVLAKWSGDTSAISGAKDLMSGLLFEKLL
jgi:hypothetical protein